MYIFIYTYGLFHGCKRYNSLVFVVSFSSTPATNPMMQSKGARDATFTRPQPSSCYKVAVAVASHS